jgi:hypothetical protein
MLVSVDKVIGTCRQLAVFRLYDVIIRNGHNVIQIRDLMYELIASLGKTIIILTVLSRSIQVLVLWCELLVHILSKHVVNVPKLSLCLIRIKDVRIRVL